MEYIFNFTLILYFKHNGMSCTKIQFRSFSSMYNHIYEGKSVSFRTGVIMFYGLAVLLSARAC